MLSIIANVRFPHPAIKAVDKFQFHFSFWGTLMDIDTEFQMLCDGTWHPPARPVDVIGAPPVAWYRLQTIAVDPEKR